MSVKRGMIHFINGQYAGSTIPLEDGIPVILGRNGSDAAILFRNSKISRKHCSICYLAELNCFMVQDFSSGGIFHANGSRFPKYSRVSILPNNILILVENEEIIQLIVREEEDATVSTPSVRQYPITEPYTEDFLPYSSQADGIEKIYPSPTPPAMKYRPVSPDLNRRSIRAAAREALRGNIFTFFLAAFIAGLISFIIPGILTFIVAGPFCYSLVKMEKDALDHKKIKAGNIFDGFSHCFGTSLVAFFLIDIFVFLWCLLLFIPGIIKIYSYSMTWYLLQQEPGITASEAITKSRKLMDGHKFELFLLELSFIGWILLGMFSFGLAFIYVLPYYNLAHVEFFNRIYDSRS